MTLTDSFRHIFLAPPPLPSPPRVSGGLIIGKLSLHALKHSQNRKTSFKLISYTLNGTKVMGGEAAQQRRENEKIGVLVRLHKCAAWWHPHFVLLYPDIFIPSLELYVSEKLVETFQILYCRTVVKAFRLWIPSSQCENSGRRNKRSHGMSASSTFWW